MKIFALALVLIAGCAAPGVAGRDAKLKEMEQRSREIADRAKQCVLTAMKRAGEYAKAADGPDSAARVNPPSAGEQREISRCKAAAARENEELLARERNEYALQSQQERDRDTLITILTTSRPH
jgi:hypothetical protein